MSLVSVNSLGSAEEGGRTVGHDDGQASVRWWEDGGDDGSASGCDGGGDVGQEPGASHRVERVVLLVVELVNE